LKFSVSIIEGMDLTW